MLFLQEHRVIHTNILQKQTYSLFSRFAEGYSTSCTEAVMLGVPVVSTQVSGAEEIIESAESGLVVENTEDGLYENLKKILEDPEVICRWERNIAEFQIQFFS